MTSWIVVREYARLTTSSLNGNTLDEARVSETAFDWLCELSGQFRSSGASLLQVEGRQWLKLDNFVGVLESPCGQVIEILPKHHEQASEPEKARELMCKMIEAAMDLPARETTEAGLQLYKAPLSEWVIGRFLAALDSLIKRGLRFDYLRIEEEQRYLRGQLDVAKQLRQPPGRQHFFQTRHDVYLPDRPENRLLKSALDLVCQRTQLADNWRLAHELAGLLHELPASRQVEQDFRAWRSDRLMAHYQPIRPWCELILRQHLPLAVHGDWRGISFLFPMEKLFERYVEARLREALPTDLVLKAQAASKSLCSYEGKPLFELRPDFLLGPRDDRWTWVLDAKWKLLDQDDRKGKYGLSQGDFYQLYAYGQKYLEGKGDMALIYPKWDKFSDTIGPFEFDSDLRVWAVPLDLDTEGELSLDVAWILRLQDQPNSVLLQADGS